MIIRYYSEDFDTAIYPECTEAWQDFSFSTFELIVAAFTVGRANRWSIFAHGPYSLYEMMYRSAMILANVAEGHNGYVAKTPAYNALDPSEKSAVSYFIGMVITKLMADKKLGIPYLMHLEVYRREIEENYGIIRYRGGKSRPDLISVNRRLESNVFEAKGRSNGFNLVAYDKAKQQAGMVISIGGEAVLLNVGAQTYFINDQLHFRWKDPNKSAHGNKYDFISAMDIIRQYYLPFYELLIDPFFGTGGNTIQKDGEYIIPLPQLDIEITIPKSIMQLYDENINKNDFLNLLDSIPGAFADKEYLNNPMSVRLGDGLQFNFRNSWNERIKKMAE